MGTSTTSVKGHFGVRYFSIRTLRESASSMAGSSRPLKAAGSSISQFPQPPQRNLQNDIPARRVSARSRLLLARLLLYSDSLCAKEANMSMPVKSTLIRLSDTTFVPAEPHQDIRGRKVID